MVNDYYDVLNIEKTSKLCELGGALVSVEPRYRNKGIMTSLSKKLCEVASQEGYDYIIATAHPDNIASNKILPKLEMKLFSTITTSSGYLRNVYCKDLKERGKENDRY